VGVETRSDATTGRRRGGWRDDFVIS